MSVGNAVRKLLGPTIFKYVGSIYRRFFVDLRELYRCFPTMKPEQCLLDIGGGDGEIMNYIMRDNPSLTVTMIDISPSVGNSIRPQYREKINIFPCMSMNEFKEKYFTNTKQGIDFILISDVVHHIEESRRREFFSDLKKLISDTTKIIIKDIEPGYCKSYLSYLSDKYITGDKKVGLVSKNAVVKYMKDISPGIRYYETELFEKNCPNYCLIFHQQR